MLWISIQPGGDGWWDDEVGMDDGGTFWFLLFFVFFGLGFVDEKTVDSFFGGGNPQLVDSKRNYIWYEIDLKTYSIIG